MINFPTQISAPSYPFKEKLEDNSLRSQFEDGSVQSRRKFTRSRDTYTVTWESMPNSEYQILKSFIKNTVHYSAEKFSWPYPKVSGTTTSNVVVRINSVESTECTQLNYWKVTLELQEV